MDCPRCESDLESYQLGNQTAHHCEECGFVGININRDPDQPESESWEEAFDRIAESKGESDMHRAEGVVTPRDMEDDSESAGPKKVTRKS